MKRFAFFLLFAVWMTGTVYSAHAAEFDENSAVFTNRYAPYSPGMVLIYNYYAPVPDANPPCTEPTCMEATGMVQYWDCIGMDVVDGVKCLKANRVIRSPAHPDLPDKEVQNNVLLTDWFAQSTDGGIYLLQTLRYHQPTGSRMTTFGAASAVLHTPAEQDIPSSIADGTYTSVPELTLGATGLGTFKNCVKETSDIFGDFYVAPGIGTVRNVDWNGAFNELVAWEFPLAVQTSLYDISGDGKTGLSEAIYALQVTAGITTPGTFTLSTDAFINNVIPAEYTCKSDTPVSPPFSWTNPPIGTKSFVLIADNLDSVPVSGFALDHWLVYDIPASETMLQKNSAVSLPVGAKHGTNKDGSGTYSGLCAPDDSGTNRYYFRLYALNIANLDPIQTNKIGLQAAMIGHVLGQTELVGIYTFGEKTRSRDMVIDFGNLAEVCFIGVAMGDDF